MTDFQRRIPAFGRRGFALGVVALMSSCTPPTAPLVLSGDDQQAIGQITGYLNGLQRFTAKFSQAGPDGYSEGYVWLERPGHLRVDYVRPAPKLMLASHGRLLLVDRTTGATTSLRLSRTPLDMLLAQQVVLTGPVKIVSLTRADGGLQLGLQKADAPGQGTLVLRFAANPLALDGVTVIDRTGRTTALQLTDMVREAPIDPARFEYQAAAPNG